MIDEEATMLAKIKKDIVEILIPRLLKIQHTLIYLMIPFNTTLTQRGNS
jgi:hypothetical protein